MDGPNGDDGYGEGIPKGILAFQALATERCRCFFGPDYNTLFKIIGETNEVLVGERGEPSCEIDCGVLGVGAYGVLIEAKYGPKECVLKAPTLSSWNHIRHESRVLGKLCNDARASTHISKLEKELKLRVLARARLGVEQSPGANIKPEMCSTIALLAIKTISSPYNNSRMRFKGLG